MHRLAIITFAIQAIAWPQAFTHGIASGDVTPTSALLWTRLESEGTVTLELSTDSEFQQNVTRYEANASAEHDFTAKLPVDSLQPAQGYYYHWISASATSDTGMFRTPPLPTESANVRFAISGDSDGTKVNGQNAYRDFKVLSAVQADRPDFFVYLGDTIYGDSALRSNGPARTLDDYRAAYKEVRDVTAVRALLKSTSILAMWDDHEVENDFSGLTVDRDLYSAGRQAFLEYMPLDSRNVVEDANCAGPPLFRILHWGKDIDLIIPDERSCRSAKAESACLAGPGTPDLGPTLPAPLRVLLGLRPSPPEGCLDALRSDSRTLLGKVQKDLFKAALRDSTAKFKFVINEVPIQQLFALPYDRWEGYAAEREEILSFIRDQEIRNVIFLTTDTHANILSPVSMDRITNTDPIAYEVVTGPIGTESFQKELQAVLGSSAVRAASQLLDLIGVQCWDLNVFSFSLVEFDSASGLVVITVKDENGAAVKNKGPSAPERDCSVTLGG